MHRRREIPRLSDERCRAESAVPDHFGGDALRKAASDAVISRSGRPLASTRSPCEWMSTKPGAATRPSASTSRSRLPLGSDEAAVTDSEVGAVRGSARPVDHQGVPDPVVEGGGMGWALLSTRRAQQAGGEGRR